MLCLSQIDGNTFQVASPQPTEYTSCTYVLAQPSDLGINAWALTPDEGYQIATAIAICWAAGYASRVVGQFLKPNQSLEGE